MKPVTCLHLSSTYAIFLLLLHNGAIGLEPISTTIAAGTVLGGSMLYAGWDTLKCRWENDCCSPPSIKHNVTQFEELFDRYVYGQHLAQHIIPKALRSHLRKLNSTTGRDPSKALVLSFHGWTGGGKNYVAKFLADALFAKGLRSKNVHLFVSTLNFPIESKADIYKIELVDWIRGNVSRCPQSLFIFDEIDKMPLGMIDGIKAFIDHHGLFSVLTYVKY